MTKNIIGFNSEDDFDRMSRSVRKSENTPQVGQQQRAKYPVGGAPIVKRGVISQIGDYDVHLVTLLSGTFTQDLVTDGLESTRSEVQAYVANEFEHHLNIGDVVLLAKISSHYWIIEAEPDCKGYCIDEDHNGNGYVYGWSFRAPNMPCCPEAGGVHLLTTSDSGVTYESSTFQCNSDGTDRKWLFKDRKLRLTPRLDEGNIEYWTDNPPASCTVKLWHYEQQRFPNRDDCGRMPKSVCLNPMCGVGTCSECSNGLSPMNYTVIIGGGESNPARVSNPYDCSLCAGTYVVKRRFKSDDSDMCQWIATDDNGYEITMNISTVSSTDYLSVTCGSLVTWGAEVPLDCSEEISMDVISYGADPPYCINFTDPITVIPHNESTLEGDCYPTTVLSDSAFCAEAPYILEIELSGITDGTCDQCNLLNDVYKMQLYNNTVGAWKGTGIAGDCLSSYSTTPGFSITKSGSTLYLKFGSLTGFMNASVTYTMDVSNFNCFGPNEFTYSSADGECTNWPSTITVYPMVSTI